MAKELQGRGMDKLSEQKIKILAAYFECQDIVQLAAKLGMARGTVHMALHAIRDKLDVSNPFELSVLCYERGYFTIDDAP